MALTLADAQTKLTMWQERLDALERQELTSGKTTEVSLAIKDALRMVQFYEGEVERLSKGRRQGARALRVVPRDY